MRLYLLPVLSSCTHECLKVQLQATGRLAVFFISTLDTCATEH